MRFRSEAETSRIPVDCAASGIIPRDANVNVATRIRARMATAPPSSRGGQTIQPFLETVFTEHRRDALVVDRRVRVEPVRPWVDREIQDLPEPRSLQQQLSTRNQLRQQIEFHWIQMEQVGVLRAIERRICEEEFRRTTLDDRPQEGRRRKVVDRLRREKHGRVPLPPGLERLLHVSPESVVLNEPPGFVHDADRELSGGCRSRQLVAYAMQDIEQQRFE